MSILIREVAGKPWGHEPGRNYHDVVISMKRTSSRWVVSVAVVWGSSQGFDEEHGRRGYGAVDEDPFRAIELAVAEARADKANETDGKALAYLSTARLRALRALTTYLELHAPKKTATE